ncbi:MAG: hypothetical protein JST30_11175 [Armatimonadetes bacterium]|nr:hypothetical protein [Armatimonadota bacterium]
MTDDLKLESLAARAESVTLPNGLVLDEVVLTSARAAATMKPFGLTLDEPGKFEVTVSDGSLAAFLEGQAPAGVSRFSVRSEAGTIKIEASAKAAFGARVAAVCRLRIENGRRLYVDLESVSLPFAHGLIEQQIAKINPIIDVEEFPGTFCLKGVDAQDGAVRLVGTLDWRHDEGERHASGPV